MGVEAAAFAWIVIAAILGIKPNILNEEQMRQTEEAKRREEEAAKMDDGRKYLIKMR